MRLPIGMNFLHPAVLFGALVFLTILSISIAIKIASTSSEDAAIARSRHKMDTREKMEKWVRKHEYSGIVYRFKG